MRKILFLLLLFVGALPIGAQEKTATGSVVDSKGEPIPDVVVVMLAADSTHLATVVTSVDGSFLLPPTPPLFSLILEHLSYESKLVACNSTTLLAPITLTEKTVAVDEVTVKAYRPLVKVTEGKLSYDLTQLSEQTTATNVYEALSYLPGVDESNGTLSLAGVGATTVIINGKPTTMSASQLETLLRSLPIERIESAEVMYSTPPQYGVRGASINLVLAKSNDYSYSGEVKSGYSHQREGSYGSGGSFMVATPKWSADAMYAYNNYYSPQRSELTTTHTVDNVTKEIAQNQDIYSEGNQHTLRAAFDYTPNEEHTFSVVYNGTYTPDVHSVSLSDGSFVTSTSDKEGDSYLHNIALRYRGASGFDVGADYTTYNTNSSGYLDNLYSNDSTTSFDVRAGQNVERLNIYADMGHDLGNGWGITYGTKATWAADKDYQYYSAMVGDVATYDTDSRLTEVNAELYAGFSKNLSQGSVSASLTGEYYNLEGKEEWTLYPQANFMWMFDPQHIIQANISSEKTYPSYWMLQDAIGYVDGYTEVHGNPYLQPMRDYSSQLVYIYQQRCIFVLFGSQTNNSFTQNSYLAPDSYTLIYKHINFDYARQYGINAILPFNMVEWIASKAVLTGLRMQQKCSDYYGEAFDRAKWVGVAQLKNTIKIGEHFSFELNGIYQTAAIQGLFDLSDSWGVDAGVKWSLLDKKLNITAQCNDIFESRMPRVVQDWQGQQLEMYTGAYSRTLSLNLSYTFGGYTKKERKEVDSSRFGH